MPRRSPGDGTLFKRADGYWVAGIELPPAGDGKRRTKRVVRKSRNEAIAAQRQMRADLAAGKITTARSVTVARWMQHWQAEILPHRNLRPSTAASYGGTIRRDVLPHLGGKRLDRLQPSDIREMHRAVTAQVSTRAAQKADQVLRLALAAAVRDGIIAASVMDRVDKPAHTPTVTEAFSAGEVRWIIETAIRCQGPTWAARWAVGFATGARESEILGIEWDRVDLATGMLDISWQLHRVPMAHGCGGTCGKRRPSYCASAWWDLPAAMEWRPCAGTLLWTRPKTRAGVRIVPLIPGLVDILRAMPDGHPNPHKLVFRHSDGRPISTEDDQRAWRALLAEAGLPHRPQHAIRHSTATLLLEAGVDAHIVQSVIGHSDTATTRRYQHISQGLAAQAWATLDRALPGSPELR